MQNAYNAPGFTPSNFKVSHVADAGTLADNTVLNIVDFVSGEIISGYGYVQVNDECALFRFYKDNSTTHFNIYEQEGTSIKSGDPQDNEFQIKLTANGLAFDNKIANANIWFDIKFQKIQ